MLYIIRVGIVVSSTYVFRLVGNMRPLLCLADLKLFPDLIAVSACSTSSPYQTRTVAQRARSIDSPAFFSAECFNFRGKMLYILLTWI